MDQDPYARIELVDEREDKKVQMKPTKVTLQILDTIEECSLKKNLNPLCFFSSLCYKRQSHAQSFIIRSCSLSFIIISNMTDFFICSYLPYSIRTRMISLLMKSVCYSIHTGSLESRQSLKFQSYSIAAQNRYLINVAPAHSFVHRKDVCALRKYVCKMCMACHVRYTG